MTKSQHNQGVVAIRDAFSSSRFRESRLLGETKLWIPQEGDQIGYNVFPSTPYGNILSIIELRGENVCEGFRVKERVVK